jgi:hypothetical protein
MGFSALHHVQNYGNSSRSQKIQEKRDLRNILEVVTPSPPEFLHIIKDVYDIIIGEGL